MTVKLAGRLAKLRDGGQQRDAPSGGLAKAFETFERGQGVARLARAQGGGLRAFGQFADNALRFGLGLAISGESAETAFTGGIVGQTITRAVAALAVNCGLNSPVPDHLRELHFSILRFSRFLCQICV